MNHIVDTCPLTKFEGGLNLLHEADDDAVIWLESTATAALAKRIITSTYHSTNLTFKMPLSRWILVNQLYPKYLHLVILEQNLWD